MDKVTIDNLSFAIFSDPKEISPGCWKLLARAFFEKQTQEEFITKLAYSLLITSPSFKSKWFRFRFWWWFKFQGSKIIHIPQPTRSGWAVLKSFKETRITLFQYALAQMGPYTRFITDFMKSEQYLFPSLPAGEAMDLNGIIVNDFIKLYNLNLDHEEGNPESLPQMAAFIYRLPVDEANKLDVHILRLIHLMYVRWFNAFASEFDSFFRKSTKNREPGQEEEFPSDGPDWNEFIVYFMPPEHFGKIEERGQTAAYNAFYYVDQEIKNKK